MKKLLLLAFIASLTTSVRAVIIGVDAGYLLDSEEAFVAARVGGAVAANDRHSHIIEFELGYTEDSEMGAKGEIIPMMLNYRIESSKAIGWGFFGGLGAGAARAEVSGFGLSFHDTTFAAQAFGGLRYSFTPTSALNLGLKYLWMDDVEFSGVSAEMGDDLALSVGLSFRF
jgi:hypothetical protein